MSDINVLNVLSPPANPSAMIAVTQPTVDSLGKKANQKPIATAATVFTVMVPHGKNPCQRVIETRTTDASPPMIPIPSTTDIAKIGSEGRVD